MKKILLFFALMCMMSVSSYASETAKCVLQHNGSATMFAASDIANAIKAAVDGDTLFLTKGQFGSFTINKQITVRGAGQETETGTITVNIPGAPILKNTLLEGLYVSGDIKLSSELDGVTINKCSFGSLSVNNLNKNILVDNCIARNYMYQNEYTKNMTVKNSKIAYLSPSSNTNIYIFVNCNILSFNANTYNGIYLHGSFINCILYTNTNTTNVYNCTFVNTLHMFNWKIQSNSSEQECYYDPDMSMDSSTMECGYNTATLKEKGYLGNDGTVVGCYGGTNPYSLELDVPKVTSSTISVDNDNKVLNVNLKVTAK